MKFFSLRNNLYPLIAIAASLFIIIFGMIEARTYNCSYFLVALFVWLCIFGCLKSCLKMLVPIIVFGGIFAGITYAASDGNLLSSIAMLNRFGALFLGIAVSATIAPVNMTRALSQLHFPRSVTLGLLIALSFVPMLKEEERRVREAMRTRGAGSILNPRIFYRAFLVPFVTRLVNISDTLALSVETRGFVLGSPLYTVYKKQFPVLSDVIFILGIIAGAIPVVIL